jgi:hypothetical protein
VPFVLGGLVHIATADVPPPFAGPGVETQTGQAVYQLPRDHAWHGGAFYQTNDYNEWHYITALGRDVETGERISVFWVPLARGWMAQAERFRTVLGEVAGYRIIGQHLEMLDAQNRLRLRAEEVALY